MKALLELSRKALLSNFRSLAFPMKVVLILTKRCNSRCLMCNIWKQTEHAGELSLKELELFFSHSANISWLDLGGGEIVLRPDIHEIADIIFTKCRNLFLLHFATNGLLPERIEAMTRRMLGHNPAKLLVTVSLDGEPATHDRIRGVAGAFERAMDTFVRLRRLAGRNFQVFLGMTLFEENSDGLDAALNAAKRIVPDLTLDEFHLNIMQHSSHYYDNVDCNAGDRRNILATIEKFRRLRPGSAVDPVRYLENRYQKLAAQFMETGRCPLPCQALSNSCFIGPTGDVHPCTMFDCKVGNLRQQQYDLGRIWRSPEAVAVRRRVRSGACPHCWTPCEAYQTIIGNTLGIRRIIG